MVLTRRQSGKLPRPRFFEYRDPDLEASQLNTIEVEELWASDLSDLSDSENEDGAEPLLPTHQTTGISSESRSTTDVHHDTPSTPALFQKYLSPLESLPLDILHEIISYLSPPGLLSMISTDRLFRNFLMSPRLAKVWRDARQRFIPPPPDRPSVLSEPAYADLLWGERCQGCGVRGGCSTISALYCRFCSLCYETRVVRWSPNATHEFPQEIFECAPGFVLLHSAGIEEAEFLKSVLVRVSSQFASFREEGVTSPERLEDLERFKEKCLAQRAEAEMFVSKYESWYIHYRRLEEARKNAEIWEIRQRFQPELLALGYRESDVETTFRLIHRKKLESFKVYLSTGQTDDIWKDIFLRLQCCENQRLGRPREEVFREREVVAWSVFQDYLQSLDPLRWLFNKSVDRSFRATLLSVPSFQEVISTTPRDIEVGKPHFNHAAMWIPSILNDYLHRCGSPLYLLESLLPPEDAGPGAVLPPATPTLRRPYRATSCLSCLQCPTRPGGYPALLSGGHTIVHHHNVQYLTFNELASEAVRSLLTTLGWDETRTSSDLLDLHDDRFVCLECPHKYDGTIFGLEALSWRQAVEHICDKQHRIPTWRLLSPQESQEVKSRETEIDPRFGVGVWQCNRCRPPPNTHEDLPDPTTRDEVFAHLLGAHNVETPQDYQDYFFDPRFAERWVHRHPVLFPQDPRAEYKPPVPIPQPSRSALPKPKDTTTGSNEIRYKCLKCISPKRKRVATGFLLSGVESHMRSKHSVYAPVLERDYALYSM